MTEKTELIQMLQKKLDGVPMDIVDHIRGEVLIDSRGKGSLQKQERTKP